jgi:hypothetical protein
MDRKKPTIWGTYYILGIEHVAFINYHSTPEKDIHHLPKMGKL